MGGYVPTGVFMGKLLFFYFIFIIILSCSSCSKQYQVLFQQKNSIPDTSAQFAAAAPEYRIKPKDVLEIKNLQNDNRLINPGNISLNQGSAAQVSQTQADTFIVSDDGSVELPALGKVQVGGLTRAEAQQLVEDLYRRQLLKNPIIELKIVNLKVTLLGEVKMQGAYPLTKDKTTLVDLLGEAGGLTDKANEKNVEIIRGSEKNPSVTVIDLSNIHSINDPRAILQSGDIVYISQNKRASRGDNAQSFSAILQPSLIVLNTALIIFALIRK